MSGLNRWAPLSGAVFVVLMVIAFALAGSSPDTNDSDASIAKYLAKGSNQDKNAIALLLVAIGVLFLIVFYSTLRTRLARTEVGSDGSSSLAFAAGIAGVAFLFVAIVLFVSPLLVAGDADEFKVSPGLYRLTQDMGYPIWVMSSMVGALVAWATASVALRTGALPKWFAWFSIVVGVICIFSLFFFPIFLYWIWIVVAGVVLVMQPVPETVPPATRNL